MEQNDLTYSGNDFLAWGYTTVFFSLAVYICLILTDNVFFYSLYLGVPIGANTIVAIYRKNKPKTEIEILVNKIWSLFGIIGVLSCIGRLFYEFPLFALISLLMGIETMITGIIIKSKTTLLCGFGGFIGAVVLVAFTGYLQNIVITIVFFIIAVVPGYIINRKNRSLFYKTLDT